MSGNCDLIKICIVNEKASETHAQLQRYGITKLALFPELQSVADEITRQVIAERTGPMET